LPGVYNAEITVNSQAGALAPGVKQWEYLTLVGIDYSDTVYLGDRAVDGGNGIQLGQWNPGLALALMTNWGNKNLNLDWEATDPELSTIIPKLGCSSSTGTCWDLTSKDDLQVDDDNIQGEVVETGLTPINIPETVLRAGFQPAGGLDVCDVITCNSVALDETLGTYFHIAPPTGLQTGTYQTTITITTNVI
jgi:hypothetical protein